MEFESAKEQIRNLIQNDELNARNDKLLLSLVLGNEEAAKAVYRDTCGQSGFPSRYKIVTALTGICKGEDIANEEIQFLVHRLAFRDCTTEEERIFREWLLTETDHMPELFPMEIKVQGFFSRQQYRTIAYMSKVSEFPARLCVYGLKKGYIELFKDTLQPMLKELGIEYTRSFIDQLLIRYDMADADFMAMASVIYAGPAKQALETKLYREYIDAWIKTDRESFFTKLCSILGDDWRKKVLKKFEKDGL